MLKRFEDNAATSLSKTKARKSDTKRYLTFFDGKHLEVYDNFLMTVFQPFNSLRFSKKDLLTW